MYAIRSYYAEDLSILEQSIAFDHEFDDATPVSLQFRFMHRTGRYLYFQLNAQMEFHDWEPVEVYCSLRDISEIKETEDLAMQLNVQMHALEKELQQSQKKHDVV